MLIQEQPEMRFLEALAHPDENAASRVVLLCKFSQTPVRAKVEQLQLMLKTVLHDHVGELYFCEGGDVEQESNNKVQGFVVKPYNYHKMMGIMDTYFAHRKD